MLRRDGPSSSEINCELSGAKNRRKLGVMETLWIVLIAPACLLAGWWYEKSRAQAARSLAQADVARLREALAERERTLGLREQDLAEERKNAATAREDAAALRAKLEAAGEQIQKITDVEQNLKTSFQALAADALDANSRRLMELA